MVAAANNRLFVNVNGGGTLTTAFETDLKRGTNTIKLPTVGRDASAGDIDVMENPAKGTAPGSVTLEKVKVDNREGTRVKNTGATLTVRSSKAQKAAFTVTCGLNAGVAIRHRLMITPEGIAEFSSQALVSNNSKTPIKNANLTITAGDNQNTRRGYPGAMLEARSYARAADTDVGAASSSVYRFDHPKKLSLAPGESAAVSLFNKDFPVGEVEKKLSFEGYGANTYNKDPRQTEAGPVATTYYIENNKENGLGVILPRGEVTIMRPDGTLLSKTNLEDTSVGKRMSLDGGTAFDIESTRKQTSFEQVGAQRPAGGRGEGKFRTVQVGQELGFKNCGAVDEKLDVSDRIEPSQDPAKPARVLEVTVNGVALAADKWSYDENEGKLSIPGIQVKAGEEVKVGYKMETSNIVY
jgi:hypothetical protein